MPALSIVAPNGANIAAGRKTLEIRSWHPPQLSLRHLLIVENRIFLTGEDERDPRRHRGRRGRRGGCRGSARLATVETEKDLCQTIDPGHEWLGVSRDSLQTPNPSGSGSPRVESAPQWLQSLLT
jgi:hypothetical protein